MHGHIYRGVAEGKLVHAHKSQFPTSVEQLHSAVGRGGGRRWLALTLSMKLKRDGLRRCVRAARRVGGEGHSDRVAVLVAHSDPDTITRPMFLGAALYGIYYVDGVELKRTVSACSPR